MHSVLDDAQLRDLVNRQAHLWGQRCRDRRESLGLSKEQVAAALDTSMQTIFRIEQGSLVPRDRLRFGLAHVLCSTVEELFPGPTREAIAATVRPEAA